MILGFKQQFLSKIEDGTKKHTIREDKNDRWRHGKVIHFATGVRTKNYNCFKIGKCVSTQIIEIRYLNKYSDYPVVTIDGKEYRFYWKADWDILCRLSINDGFNSFTAFCKWFNKDFKGKIIHWTDLKY